VIHLDDDFEQMKQFLQYQILYEQIGESHLLSKNEDPSCTNIIAHMKLKFMVQIQSS